MAGGPVGDEVASGSLFACEGCDEDEEDGEGEREAGGSGDGNFSEVGRGDAGTD